VIFSATVLTGGITGIGVTSVVVIGVSIWANAFGESFSATYHFSFRG
jgi:hypothetical protein